MLTRNWTIANTIHIKMNVKAYCMLFEMFSAEVRREGAADAGLYVRVEIVDNISAVIETMKNMTIAKTMI